MEQNHPASMQQVQQFGDVLERLFTFSFLLFI